MDKFSYLLAMESLFQQPYRTEGNIKTYFVSKFRDFNSINKCKHLNLTLGAGGGGGAGYTVGAVTLSSAD